MKKSDVATDEQTMQINVKVPWAKAVGAKRLARQRGVPLNTFITELITRELKAEAETLRAQLAKEEQELAMEREALLAALDQI
ncbi:hypothetical protein AB0M12_40240 [Nocardia vinacea]|uniref:hypothetical protein n=1 Tax=Nocardia vinacea TaxID=96468 RepID=UPI0034124EF8